MARPLLLAEAANHTTASYSSHAAGAGAAAPLLLLLVAAAAVTSVIVSLCTSSKNAKPWTKQRRANCAAPPAQLEEKLGGSFLGKKQLLASLSGVGGSKKQLLASLSGIGGKAAAVAKMVSWNKRSPAAAEADDWSGSASDDGHQVAAGEAEDDAVWKKGIIMGDKCRPLEFSGQIAYDSDGNLLPPPAESVKKSATADAGDR